MRQTDAQAKHAVPPRDGPTRPATERLRPIVLVVESDVDDGTLDAIEMIRAYLPGTIELRLVDRCVVDDTLAVADPDRFWSDQLSTLSKREREVLQELVDGYPFADAAARLFVSRHTFRTHMKNILAKFDVHSSLEAVSIGVRAGMRPRGTDPEPT